MYLQDGFFMKFLEIRKIDQIEENEEEEMLKEGSPKIRQE